MKVSFDILNYYDVKRENEAINPIFDGYLSYFNVME
jgi:hypothetical protein